MILPVVFRLELREAKAFPKASIIAGSLEILSNSFTPLASVVKFVPTVPIFWAKVALIDSLSVFNADARAFIFSVFTLPNCSPSISSLILERSRSFRLLIVSIFLKNSASLFNDRSIFILSPAENISSALLFIACSSASTP